MPKATLTSTASVTLSVGRCDTVKIKNTNDSPADLTVAITNLNSGDRHDVLEPGDSQPYRIGSNTSIEVVLNGNGAIYIWSPTVVGS